MRKPKVDIAQLARDRPRVVEMLRAGATFGDIERETGTTWYYIRQLAVMFDCRRGCRGRPVTDADRIKAYMQSHPEAGGREIDAALGLPMDTATQYLHRLKCTANGRREAVSKLPRVSGHPEYRWRQYVDRMISVDGHKTWRNVTYWAGVAFHCRLYADIDKVFDMLPLLLYDLDRRQPRRACTEIWKPGVRRDEYEVIHTCSL